jgi:hypothetical protein
MSATSHATVAWPTDPRRIASVECHQLTTPRWAGGTHSSRLSCLGSCPDTPSRNRVRTHALPLAAPPLIYHHFVSAMPAPSAVRARWPHLLLPSRIVLMRGARSAITRSSSSAARDTVPMITRAVHTRVYTTRLKPTHAQPRWTASCSQAATQSASHHRRSILDVFTRFFHSSPIRRLLDAQTHEAAKEWNLAARLGTIGTITTRDDDSAPQDCDAPLTSALTHSLWWCRRRVQRRWRTLKAGSRRSSATIFHRVRVTSHIAN